MEHGGHPAQTIWYDQIVVQKGGSKIGCIGAAGTKSIEGGSITGGSITKNIDSTSNEKDSGIIFSNIGITE